jgi:TonB family protein
MNAIRMPSGLRVACALALSALLHLALLAVPADGRLSGVESLRRDVRLAAVLLPAAAVPSMATGESASRPQPKPRAQRIVERIAASNRSEEQPFPSLPVAQEPPDIAPWFDAEDLDVQPRPLSRIRPDYPGNAMPESGTGRVTLQMHIDELGIVREARVVTSSHQGLFDHAALRAGKSLRFVPGEKDFRFVRSRILHTMEFTIAEPPR